MDPASILRRQPELVVLMALRHLTIPDAAISLWKAERAGLNRTLVLRAAERRIEELGGTEVDGGGPTLIIRATTIDVDELAWRKEKCLS